MLATTTSESSSASGSTGSTTATVTARGHDRGDTATPHAREVLDEHRAAQHRTAHADRPQRRHLARPLPRAHERGHQHRAAARRAPPRRRRRGTAGARAPRPRGSAPPAPAAPTHGRSPAHRTPPAGSQGALGARGRRGPSHTCRLSDDAVGTERSARSRSTRTPVRPSPGTNGAVPARRTLVGPPSAPVIATSPSRTAAPDAGQRGQRLGCVAVDDARREAHPVRSPRRQRTAGRDRRRRRRRRPAPPARQAPAPVELGVERSAHPPVEALSDAQLAGSLRPVGCRCRRGAPRGRPGGSRRRSSLGTVPR